MNFSIKYLNVNLKTLQIAQATSSTFFTIFEFLLNQIGVKNVWNPNLLNQGQSVGNTPMSSSQPQQNNPAAQQKLRTDLICYHLQTLRYHSIPKPSVFQTMTSPKNWVSMLQILYFLANCIKVSFLD